ncbi:MAG: superinfection immunity protein [Dehalococcoidia bacterium]|nr:superinfection immunity protein [Dehalococcoidia bacterium]
MESMLESLGLLGIGIIWLVVVCLVLIYFLPGIVAIMRHKQNRVSICILNLLAGWTAIGWVAALVWAFSVDR